MFLSQKCYVYLLGVPESETLCKYLHGGPESETLCKHVHGVSESETKCVNICSMILHVDILSDLPIWRT